MSDAYVAHLKERVTIPPAAEIDIEPRRYFEGPKDKYLPFKRDKDFVPPMVDIGKGYKFHVTGLTHDDHGYPIMFEECQEYNVHPLVKKIRNFTDNIIEVQEAEIEDAEVIIVSYGATSRAALKAMEQARKSGVKVGSLKLVTVWPFPEKRIRELAKKIKAFVVPEINYGQIVLEVERCAKGQAPAIHVPHCGGWVHDPDDIFKAIKEAVK